MIFKWFFWYLWCKKIMTTNINYRQVPECVMNLILDKQLVLTKKKKRKVSQSETITTLLKEAYVKEKK